MGSREGPNPLRPYYIPPSIGLDPGPSTSKAASAPASTSHFGTAARDIFADLDYSDYLAESSPSLSDSVKELLDSAVRKYASVLIAQPFEVAKTILQVYVAPDPTEGESIADDRQRRRSHGVPNSYDDEEESPLSSDDETSYFTSAAPETPSSSRSRGRRPHRRVTDRSGYIPQSTSSKKTLIIKNPSSLTEVLSGLWSTSGPLSMWRASSSTFIYSLLLPTLNTFIRSLLAAILGLPEDGASSPIVPDILTSTSPTTTLVLTFLASALSAIILSPIDTARTLLILTPATHGPRSLLRAIRRLPTPSYTVPPHVVPITVLHSGLPNLLSASTPLILKSYLSLDPVLNPSSWSLFTFLSSGLELGIRFPLETVLRRAQITTFTSPALRQQSKRLVSPATPSFAKSPAGSIAGSKPDGSEEEVETIIPVPRSYRGVVGTMWSIVYEENAGPSEADTPEALLRKDPRAAAAARRQKRRQGQGVQGLYRGWRIGMWGTVGAWASGFLGYALGGGEDVAPGLGGTGSGGGAF